MDNIKTLRKERNAELKVDQERLKFLKSDKDKAQRVRWADGTSLTSQMRSELDDMVAKETAKTTEAEDLKTRFHDLKEENEALYKRATGFTHIFERHDNLQSRKQMLETNRDRMLDGMNVLSGEAGGLVLQR